MAGVFGVPVPPTLPERFNIAPSQQVLAIREQPGSHQRELVAFVATPDGMLLGRCESEPDFRGFLSIVDDLLRNILGRALVAELDGHEMGYLVARVAEIKRRR